MILSVREEKERGKGYWKLNVSILIEESYNETTCKIIRDTVAEYMHQVDKTMISELIKIKVKEFSIQYCQSRNRKKNNDIKKLETQIHVLDQQIQSCNSEEVITEMTTERKYL